jgi:signal transduction histidine kinase
VRKGFRLSLAHLVLFVIVALVLNAQFTWWIFYSLRQNRERLDVDRELIGLRARNAAFELTLRLEDAADALLLLPPGTVPRAGATFAQVRVLPVRQERSSIRLVPSSRGDVPPVGEAEVATATDKGWVLDEQGRPALTWPLDATRRVVATLDPQAPYRWLASIDPHLELKEVGAAAGEPTPVALRPPLDHLEVVPDRSRWQRELVQYRRRVVVVVVEGALFFLAMVATVVVLWTVVRRETALQQQSQNFVSAVTHELKTPIAGIRVALETVLGGRVDADGSRRFLGNALHDVERLSDLVEKVLDVTRYGGGAHRLQVVLDDLSQLVEEEVAAASRRARARGVELTADIQADVRAPFDSEALAIVVSNLLENAMKYAQGTPPRVSVRLALSGGDAVLEISDNGIGITERDRERIFEAFYRAADDITRRTPGTGIGLYVAREIVDAHGGRLTAHSGGSGKGATFRLVLPGADEYTDDELSG